MKRRQLLILSLAFATPIIVRSQPLRRIGYLVNGKATGPSPERDAFRRALLALGWVEGRNVAIEYRYADGSPDKINSGVRELAAAGIDVMVVSGTPAIRAAENATRTTPIVFVVLADPVTTGLVPSLARPGGNLTGVASQYEDIVSKQLQLLKEAVPSIARVALLYEAQTPPALLASVREAARVLGLSATEVAVRTDAQIEGAFKSASEQRADGIHVLPSPFFAVHHARLVDLAARYRLPAVYELSSYVEDGGLLAYGPNLDEMFARAAVFVDRILKGARAGDLAIERPAKFELAINVRTAAALSIAIPPALLARADVIVQ